MPCCGGFCVCNSLPFACSLARALWKHNLSLADWTAGLKLVSLQRGGQREGKACWIIKLSFRVWINTV